MSENTLYILGCILGLVLIAFIIIKLDNMGGGSGLFPK